ncbi:MAG: hypothetical protein ACI94Y_003264 [Maribacter sp.]|jgi:hypothetical protein
MWFAKKVSFIFFALIISISLSAQEEDCNKFYRGCFIFEANENESYLIKRTRKYQNEIEIHSATQISTQLRWLNDCTYELIYPRKEASDTIPLQDIPILINIFDIKGNTFFFKSSGFDDMIILEGKMRKIKRREYRRKKRMIKS